MSKKLRITLVTETYFPQVNGVSRTLDRLVRYCSEQGDEIQLFIPNYRNDSVHLPDRVEKHEWCSIPLPFYKEVVLPVVTARKLEKTMSSFRPDVIHIATEGPLGYAALRASKRLKIPVVSSYHTNFPQYLKTYKTSFLEPVCWRYLRWFHNSTRATFCPSKSTMELLGSKGFYNVDIWSRGVDNLRFNPAKRDVELRNDLGVGADDLIMTYAGRLANEKNLKMLLEAWELIQNHQNCFLLFIGDGPLRQRFESLQLPRVIFAGYCYGENLARMYASSDLFVFPSLSETFGNVVLEAMASGLPVVGYNVQGPRDIIQDKITGLLVDPISPKTLAAAIQQLIEKEELRIKMSQQARSYAESRTWEQVLKAFRNQYIAHVNPTDTESIDLMQADKSTV